MLLTQLSKLLLSLLAAFFLTGCATTQTRSISQPPTLIKIDPGLLEPEEPEFDLPNREEYESMSLSERFYVTGMHVIALKKALYLANKKLKNIQMFQSQLEEKLNKE